MCVSIKIIEIVNRILIVASTYIRMCSRKDYLYIV